MNEEYEIVDDLDAALQKDAPESTSPLYRKHGCPSCRPEQICWCTQIPYSLIHVPHYPAGRNAVHTLKSPPVPFQVGRLLVFGRIELGTLEVDGHEVTAWLHRPRTPEMQALTVRARVQGPSSHPALECSQHLVPLQLLPHTRIRLGIRNEHTQPEDWGASLIGGTATPVRAIG